MAALRVTLTVLVTAPHAGQAYGPTGGAWPVSELRRSALLGPFFAVNPMFFMGLFFLLGGYFAAYATDRKGAAGKAKEADAKTVGGEGKPGAEIPKEFDFEKVLEKEKGRARMKQHAKRLPRGFDFKSLLDKEEEKAKERSEEKDQKQEKGREKSKKREKDRGFDLEM